MNKTHPDGAAFPRAPEDVPGLTVREYFAAQALQALADFNGMAKVQDVARAAVTLADALIVALRR
jgi:hypothetical protein